MSGPALSQIAMCYDEATGAVGMCPSQEGSFSGSYGGGLTIEGDPSPFVSGRDQLGRQMTEALEDLFRGSSRETERRRQEFERDWERAVQAIQRQRILSKMTIESAEKNLSDIREGYRLSPTRDLDRRVVLAIRETGELSLEFDFDTFHFAPTDNWYLLDYKTPVLSPNYVALREATLELFRARRDAFDASPGAFDLPDYSSEEVAALPEWAAYSLAEHFLRVADALFAEGRQVEGDQYLSAAKSVIETAKTGFPLRSVSEDYGFYQLIDFGIAPAPAAWASTDRYNVRSATMTQNTRDIADQVFGKFAELGGEGTFTVTSAYRSPESQASAMFGIIAADGNFALYGEELGPPIAREFIAARLEAEERFGRPVPIWHFRDEAIDRMVSAIEDQVEMGRFLSDHMRNNALDISISGMSAAKRELILKAARGLGLTADVHTNPPHIHISCKNVDANGVCEFENGLEISPSDTSDTRSQLDGPSIIREEYSDSPFYSLPIVTNCPSVEIDGQRFRSVFFLTGFGSEVGIISDTGATQALYDQVFDDETLKVRPFQLLVKEEFLAEFRSRSGASWLGLAVGNSLYTPSPDLALICNVAE